MRGTAGEIFFLDKHLTMTRWFGAYSDMVYHLAFANERNVLVSVGLDKERGNDFVFKFWDMDRWINYEPTLMETIVPESNIPIAAFAVHDDLSCFAVAYYTGKLYLYTGSVEKGYSRVSVDVKEGNNVMAVTSMVVVLFNCRFNVCEKG